MINTIQTRENLNQVNGISNLQEEAIKKTNNTKEIVKDFEETEKKIKQLMDRRDFPGGLVKPPRVSSSDGSISNDEQIRKWEEKQQENNKTNIRTPDPLKTFSDDRSISNKEQIEKVESDIQRKKRLYEEKIKKYYEENKKIEPSKNTQNQGQEIPGEKIKNEENNSRTTPPLKEDFYQKRREKFNISNKKDVEEGEKNIDYEENKQIETRNKSSNNLSNKFLKFNEGEIKTGEIEEAKLPNTIIDELITQTTDIDGNAENINIYINNPKLNGLLLSRNGNYLFGGAQGRIFTLAKVGNFYLPFYISSAGTSGKKQGKRYPFFGFTGNWLVKPDVVPSTLESAKKEGYNSIEEATDKYRKYSGRNINPGDFIYFENDNTKAIQEIDNTQKILNENFKIPAKWIHIDGKIKDGENNTIFDINDFTKYEYSKDGNNDKEYTMSKIGFNPEKVYNNGEGSSDNRMKNIINLI